MILDSGNCAPKKQARGGNYGRLWEPTVRRRSKFQQQFALLPRFANNTRARLTLFDEAILGRAFRGVGILEKLAYSLTLMERGK